MYKNIRLTATILCLSAVTLFSCQKDSDSTPADTGLGNIVLVTVPLEDKTAFVGTIPDLAVGSYTNTDALQTYTRTFAFTYKDWVFMCPRQLGDVFKRYRRTTRGLVADGEVTLPSGAAASNIVFVDDHKAYMNYRGLGKVVVFDPTAFTLTKEIDFSGQTYAIGDNNPDPVNLHVRAGKLFVSFFQDLGSEVSASSAYVGVVNVADDKIEKMIVDNRTASAGGHPGFFGNMFTTEDGDLYINCVASFGAKPGQHHGFLRIKAGQTDFDPTYFFDLTNYQIEGVQGGVVSYLYTLIHAGKGIAYGRGGNLSLFSNPADYIADRDAEPLQIDVINQKVTKLQGIPISNEYASDVCIYQGKVIFSTSSKTENGLYTYDLATGQASPKAVVNVQNFPWCLRTF